MIKKDNNYIKKITGTNNSYLPSEVKIDLEISNDLNKKKKYMTSDENSIQSIDPHTKISYKDIIAIENLKNGLKRTKSNISPGIDGEIKKDITEKRIHKLHKDLKLQRYRPKKSKRISIPKPNGDVRYISISSQIDKVIQAALLNVLESRFEKIFHNISFGFRPGKGCHDALKHIKYNWKNITWIIEFDLEKYFDKINHEVLLMTLRKHCDQATIELITKLLKVGYVDIHNLSDRSEYNKEGTPQGSLISPILSNIYLHDLDEYIVKELIPAYNRGKKRKELPAYSKRYKLCDEEKEVTRKFPFLKKALLRKKHNEFILNKKKNIARDPMDEKFRRIHYARYADDFIIGFIGPRKEAKEILEKISIKLEELKLKLNMEKSKISHGNTRKIKFLGIYIRYYNKNKIEIRKDNNNTDNITKTINSLQAKAVNDIEYRVPVDHIIKRFTDKGIAKKMNNKKYRATALFKYCGLDDDIIVKRFSSIIRGLMNYYSCVNRKSDLWSILSILRKSCALTLAHKHKIHSASKAFKKYGPNLKIKNKVGLRITSLTYPKSLKTNIKFGTDLLLQYAAPAELETDVVKGSSPQNIKNAKICQYENCIKTLNLEAHHINPIGQLYKRKDLTEFEKNLIRVKRKVVMLCKKHHNLLHKKGLSK